MAGTVAGLKRDNAAGATGCAGLAVGRGGNAAHPSLGSSQRQAQGLHSAPTHHAIHRSPANDMSHIQIARPKRSFAIEQLLELDREQALLAPRAATQPNASLAMFGYDAA